jgi:hypothetical protein
MVRCKYKCSSVTKKTAYYGKPGFLYEAEFAPVTGGSEENKAFFDATPSGSFKVGTYVEDHFEPGKEYYLDIAEAVAVPA